MLGVLVFQRCSVERALSLQARALGLSRGFRAAVRTWQRAAEGAELHPRPQRERVCEKRLLGPTSSQERCQGPFGAGCWQPLSVLLILAPAERSRWD